MQMPEDHATLPHEVLEVRIIAALRSINGSFGGSLEPVRRGVGSHAVRPAYAPMPVSAVVLDIRLTVCNRLGTYARMVIAGQDLHPQGLRAGDVAALTHFLGIHAQWLSTLGSGEAVMERLEESATALAGISTPATDASTLLGACPLTVAVDGSARPCAGQVRSAGGTGTCNTCGTSGDTPWWEHHMFPEASRLVTAQELRREVHRQRGQRISVGTIRWWVNKGIIASAGKDTAGRALFDKGAVAQALAKRDCA